MPGTYLVLFECYGLPIIINVIPVIIHNDDYETIGELNRQNVLVYSKISI